MEAQYLGTLFKILFFFILINFGLNWLLYRINKNRAYAFLFYYWLSLSIIFPIQAFFLEDELVVALGFMLSILPTSIVTKFVDEINGIEYPIKKYSLFYLASLSLSLVLQQVGLSFHIFALPVVLAPALPLLRSTKYIFWSRAKHATPVARLMGLLFMGAALHGFNFLLYRSIPQAQFWGWTISFVFYQLWAVLLPAFALEETTAREKERLSRLVKQRTADLSLALDELNKNILQTRNTLRVLVHDIANPIHTQLFCLEQLLEVQHDRQNVRYLNQIKRAALMMKEISEDVREIECVRSGKKPVELEAVDFDECIEELNFLFSEKLEAKNIVLSFNNRLPQGVKLHVNKQSFVHSVLGNLLSNSLKFSPRGSRIQLTAEEVDGKLNVVISDQGVGIDPDQLNDLFDPLIPTSRDGVHGESGSGFGLPIVKAYVDHYAGQIQVQSKQQADRHGTDVTLTLNRA